MCVVLAFLWMLALSNAIRNRPRKISYCNMHFSKVHLQSILLHGRVRKGMPVHEDKRLSHWRQREVNAHHITGQSSEYQNGELSQRQWNLGILGFLARDILHIYSIALNIWQLCLHKTSYYANHYAKQFIDTISTVYLPCIHIWTCFLKHKRHGFFIMNTNFCILEMCTTKWEYEYYQIYPNRYLNENIPYLMF